MAYTIPRAATWRSRIRDLRAAATARATLAVARARRTSRVARARAGYAGGVLSSVWGVGVLWGVGWSLLLGGVAASVSFLVLYPVDEP